MSFWTFVLAYGLSFLVASLAFEAIKWGWRVRKKRIAESDAAHVAAMLKNIERNQAIERMCIDRKHADSVRDAKEKVAKALEDSKVSADRSRKRLDAMLDDLNPPFFRAMSDKQLYFAALAQIASGDKSNALIGELTRRSML